MPFYDFIVKFQKLDLVDLLTLYWKKDESQIASDGLKLSIASPFSLSEIVRGIYERTSGS